MKTTEKLFSVIIPIKIQKLDNMPREKTDLRYCCDITLKRSEIDF